MASNAAGLKLAEATTTQQHERASRVCRRCWRSARRSRQVPIRRAALHQVLAILERHHAVMRSSVALLTPGGRHRGRRVRRAAGRQSRREIPAGRGHHGSRRAERQAHRRAAHFARTDVPAAHLGSPRAGARRDQLRVRADSAQSQSRRCAWAPISGSRPSATSIAP